MFNPSIAAQYANLMTVVSVKFVLIVFLILAIILIVKKAQPWLILLAAATAAAISYALISHGLALSFWGLTGDDATIDAMYNTFAHAGFFSDFAYHNLPPFYPPLFFWIFALIGKIMSWNGVTIGKFASVVSLFAIPVGVFLLGKFFNDHDEEKLPPAVPLIFSLLTFILIDVNDVIGKPYEVLAAAVVILWTIYLVRKVQRGWNWRWLLVFGVIGGLVFMTYYLWLIFALIAIALYALTVEKKEQFVFYGRLIAVAGIALLVASPYLFPLIYSCLKFGTENWQTAIFTPGGLAYALPALTDLSWRGAVLLLGLGSAIYYRKNEFIKPALCLLITSYLWWAMGLATLFFFNTPFQEFRGFGLFDRLSLGFCAAFALVQLYNKFKEKIGPRAQETALIVGLLILSLYLPCGSFIDSIQVQQRMIASKTLYTNEVGLFNFLEHDRAASQGLVLESGLAELPAFVPINTFVYFDQHNSHPAAHFSDRQTYVKSMAAAQTPQEFYNLTDTPYGKITRLILAKDKGNYLIYFNIDEPVVGVKEDNVIIKADLISDKYFQKIYDDAYFTVWSVK